MGLAANTWVDLVRTRASRRTIFLAACAIAITYASYALFLKGAGDPVQARGSKPTAVFLEGGTTIGQSFRAGADGLDSIELGFGRMDFPLSTDLRCELLHAEGGTWRSVHQWVEHLELPASGGAHRFRIAPIAGSKGEIFRFTVRLDRPGLKVPLEASVDNAFDGGAMTIDGREEWGDLVFEAGAMASSVFGRFRLTATGLPWFVRAPWVQIAIMAAFVWAWLSLAYWLFVVPADVS